LVKQLTAKNPLKAACLGHIFPVNPDVAESETQDFRKKIRDTAESGAKAQPGPTPLAFGLPLAGIFFL